MLNSLGLHKCCPFLALINVGQTGNHGRQERGIGAGKDVEVKFKLWV